jgi:hypothetical protein
MTGRFAPEAVSGSLSNRARIFHNGLLPQQRDTERDDQHQDFQRRQ